MSRKLEGMEKVSRLIAQRPEDVAGLAVQLWASLALELIPIVGEAGFTILYSRSLHITQRTYPWIAASSAPQAPDSQFDSLKTQLEAQHCTEAGQAFEALLVTFIGILALLIGEPLTNGMLHAAWGDSASEITIRSSPHE